MTQIKHKLTFVSIKLLANIRFKLIHVKKIAIKTVNLSK